MSKSIFHLVSDCNCLSEKMNSVNDHCYYNLIGLYSLGTFSNCQRLDVFLEADVVEIIISDCTIICNLGTCVYMFWRWNRCLSMLGLFTDADGTYWMSVWNLRSWGVTWWVYPMNYMDMVCTFIMTSSNGNIFRVTGPLCGEFTGHRWIPRSKASDTELWCFLWSAPEWMVE